MEITQTPVKMALPADINGQPLKAFITWMGLTINDPAINVVSLVATYMREVIKLSCGECSMGYNGTRLLSASLERLCAGDGGEDDLALLSRLPAGIHANAACDFCRQAVKPVIDSLAQFANAFKESATSHAPFPKTEYQMNVTAPCMEACPLHQDIPGYIELTRHHRYNDALGVIRQTNCLPGVLGRTCVAFCEKNCTRGKIDQPVAIRSLKRVSADYGFTRHPRESENKKDKVAVIGCGPAGIVATDYLARRGYQVYLIDEQTEPGGMTAAGIGAGTRAATAAVPQPRRIP